MKFTISYKSKLKMAQNLSDRSSTGQGRSVPVPLTGRKKRCVFVQTERIYWQNCTKL